MQTSSSLFFSTCGTTSLPTPLSIDVFEEDMEIATQASLGIVTNPSLTTLLRTWVLSSMSETEENQEIIIHRGKIWESTKRATSRPDFSFKKPFRVLFSGEIGADEGGPKREYLSLLIRELDRKLFEGSESKQNFLHSLKYLEQQQYEFAGIYVAWSLLHGGPGLPIFLPAIYDALIGKDPNFVIEDVLDTDIQKKIKMEIDE